MNMLSLDDQKSIRCTPAMALGIADRVWMLPDLIEAAIGTQPIKPEPTAPALRRAFRVIEGGKQ